MAKKITRRGHCPSCHTQQDGVFTGGSRSSAATFAWKKHNAPALDPALAYQCSLSGRPLPIHLWPDWAAERFED
jgi:hypothetical protein